jgi:adenylylsulfate kinase-like enzyme
VQAEYEAPEHADLTVHGGGENPEIAAGHLIGKLTERQYL